MGKTKVYTNQRVFYADFEYDNFIAWNLGFGGENWEIQAEFYLFCPEFSKNDFSRQRKEKKKCDDTFVNISNRH